MCDGTTEIGHSGTYSTHYNPHNYGSRHGQYYEYCSHMGGYISFYIILLTYNFNAYLVHFTFYCYFV